MILIKIINNILKIKVNNVFINQILIKVKMITKI
jgi:hypothetical protein